MVNEIFETYEPNFTIGNYYPEHGGYFLYGTKLNNKRNVYYFSAPCDIGSITIPWRNKLYKEQYLSSYKLSSVMGVQTESDNILYNGNLRTYQNNSIFQAIEFCKNLFMNVNNIRVENYFLPSIEELRNISVITNVFDEIVPITERWKPNLYWSSTEYDIDNAWVVETDYYEGKIGVFSASKDVEYKVRAIRKEIWNITQ